MPVLEERLDINEEFVRAALQDVPIVRMKLAVRFAVEDSNSTPLASVTLAKTPASNAKTTNAKNVNLASSLVSWAHAKPNVKSVPSSTSSLQDVNCVPRVAASAIQETSARPVQLAITMTHILVTSAVNTVWIVKITTVVHVKLDFMLTNITLMDFVLPTAEMASMLTTSLENASHAQKTAQ
jgi:hypothetical protein